MWFCNPYLPQGILTSYPFLLVSSTVPLWIFKILIITFLNFLMWSNLLYESKTSLFFSKILFQRKRKETYIYVFYCVLCLALFRKQAMMMDQLSAMLMPLRLLLDKMKMWYIVNQQPYRLVLNIVGILLWYYCYEAFISI